MLDVGGASALLVVTEFVLGLLLTSAIAFASRLRAQRILFTTGYLDLSEIAWTSRRSLDPRLLFAGPCILLFNVARFLGPCVVLILFALIGNSLTEVADVENFEPLRTQVHAVNSHWDTLGAVWNVFPIIDRGLSKGEWKGTPSTGFVPVNNTEFARLKWSDENPSEYKCTKVSEKEDEYAVTIFQQRVTLNVRYSHLSSGLTTEGSRVRKVGDVNNTLEWFSTPYQSNHLNIQEYDLSQDEAEMKYSSGVSTKDWSEFVSGAAYRLKYSLASIPAKAYASPEWETFRNITWALDGDNYVTLLNKISGYRHGSSTTELTPKQKSNCAVFSTADVVVDFVGIPNGKRALVDCANSDRIDVARGMGIRQRFVCQRKQKPKKGSCDMLAISTSTLAAGIAAKLGVSSIYGVTNRCATLKPNATRFTEKLDAGDVAEAMQLGLHVLTAGTSAKQEAQEIFVLKMTASLNWMLYAISTGIVVGIVCVVLGTEFLARLRLRKLRLPVEAPLYPLQMARACGVDEAGSNAGRRRETPLKGLGIGARLKNAGDHGANCFIDIGSRDNHKTAPAGLDFVEQGESE